MNVQVMNVFVDHLLVQIYREITNVNVISFIVENDVKKVGENYLLKDKTIFSSLSSVSGIGLFMVIISSIVVLLIIAFLILFTIRTCLAYQASKRVSRFSFN